jgi:hypothetical protein
LQPVRIGKTILHPEDGAIKRAGLGDAAKWMKLAELLLFLFPLAPLHYPSTIIILRQILRQFLSNRGPIPFQFRPPERVRRTQIKVEKDAYHSTQGNRK